MHYFYITYHNEALCELMNDQTSNFHTFPRLDIGGCFGMIECRVRANWIKSANQNRRKRRYFLFHSHLLTPSVLLSHILITVTSFVFCLSR